ncbi:MAG: dienelactone hydrolase family protein [Parasphingopyxis sp.]
MTIEREVVIHDGTGGPFEGVAVSDGDWEGPRPGVMLVPNVLGTKEADFKIAERLAGLGYAAFVADLYGRGKRATRQDENPARFMNALNADRPLLRDRLLASLATMKGLAGVDAGRCAAIGYCFGGKSVLDLARAGGDLLGVVSFHGIYDPPDYQVDAITAKILVCHGWDDPLAPPDSLVALGSELTEAGADWQILAFGHAGHGFTDKSANMPERGVVYEAGADRRSWAAMERFLTELFD